MWCVAPLEMNEGNSLGARVQSAYRLRCRKPHTRPLICQFWIFREPVPWPWSNLVANQRRPYRRDGHTVHKFSQRRLTADWLVPRESDCSRMRNKVAFDSVSGCITVTPPVIEILKMDWYCTEGPRTFIYVSSVIVRNCSSPVEMPDIRRYRLNNWYRLVLCSCRAY